MGTFTNLFEYVPNMFMFVFIGQLPDSSRALASAALGRNFFNAGYSVAYGLTCALHTFAPQAEGAGRPDLHQLHGQRAVVICTVAFVPLMLLQFNSTAFLQVLGQDSGVAEAA